MSTRQNRNRKSNDSGLTSKQQAALARAPAAQRAKLRQAFRGQNVQPAVCQPNRRPAMAVRRMLPSGSRAGRAATRSKANGPKYTAKQLIKMWNPLNPRPIPTIVSDGHAHATTGMDRVSLTVGSESRAMVIVTNTGSAGLCGTVFTWNSSVLTLDTFVLPTLAGSSLNGTGPTAGRAMKCSLSVLNSTPSRRIGGTVAFLNATQRIVWPELTQSNLSIAQANALFQQIIDQQQTTLQTGEHYRTAKSFYAHPGNESEYVGYLPFEGSTKASDQDPSLTADSVNDANRFLFSVSTATPFAGPGETYPQIWEPRKRPMSTLVFLVDTPVELQNYTFTARGSFYTRWPMEHVLGQHHPPVPTAAASVVNGMRDVGESMGHVAHEVEDVALLPVHIAEEAAASALHAAQYSVG